MSDITNNNNAADANNDADKVSFFSKNKLLLIGGAIVTVGAAAAYLAFGDKVSGLFGSVGPDLADAAGELGETASDVAVETLADTAAAIDTVVS